MWEKKRVKNGLRAGLGEELKEGKEGRACLLDDDAFAASLDGGKEKRGDKKV